MSQAPHRGPMKEAAAWHGMRTLCIAVLGIVSMVPRCCCKGSFRSVVLGEGGREGWSRPMPARDKPTRAGWYCWMQKIHVPTSFAAADWFSIHGGGISRAGEGEPVAWVIDRLPPIEEDSANETVFVGLLFFWCCLLSVCLPLVPHGRRLVTQGTRGANNAHLGKMCCPFWGGQWATDEWGQPEREK